MVQDDIDWVNASSDCGLVSLCRELAELSEPARLASAIARHARRRLAKAARRSAPRTASSQLASA